MNPWPYQKNCIAFYGDPRGKYTHENAQWKRDNLVVVKPPFRMTYAGQPIKGITIHRKCAPSLERILLALWVASGLNQAKLDDVGITKFSGSYNPRLMRTSGSISMHWFGCAIDFDAQHHQMVKGSPPFPAWVMKCFADEGWVNLPGDRMHFQAALVHGLPVPGVVTLAAGPANPVLVAVVSNPAPRPGTAPAAPRAATVTIPIEVGPAQKPGGAFSFVPTAKTPAWMVPLIDKLNEVAATAA